MAFFDILGEDEDTKIHLHANCIALKSLLPLRQIFSSSSSSFEVFFWSGAQASDAFFTDAE